MNSFVTHPKVSVLLLFLMLFFLLGSNPQATPATQSTENRNIKSPVNEIQLSPKEKAWLQDKHIVRVRVGNYPPLMFGDGGEIRGIAIDYVNLIFTRNGIKFKYISGNEVTWPEALEYIKKHEVIDMVPTAKVTQKRKEYMLFTNEYIFAPWVIFTREDSDFISTITDLKGKTVSVQEGYVMHEKLEREYPEINLLVSSANSIDYAIKPIKDVSFGQADAFIGNLLMTTYMLQAQGYTNVKVAAPTPFGNHNQSTGIRNDWPELVSIINKTLGSMTPAEHAAIRNKWLSMRFEYGISPTYVLKWVSGIIGVAALILIMILLWNRKLSRDIQERKRAEEALRESEGKYRGLVEGLNEAMYRMSLPDGKYEYMSPAARKVFGYSAEEFIEDPLIIRELIHPDFAEYFKEKWADLIEGKFPPTYTYKILDPEGNERWIVQSNTGIFDDSGNIIAIEGLCRDITKEVQAEKALRESEELHKEAQRVAHIGHWELNPEIGTPVWSDEIFRIFGLIPQEGEPSFTDHETHLHPDDWPLLNKAVTLASTEGTPFDIIFRIVRSDGEIRWMHSIGTTSKDEKGKATKLFGTAQDITDRKQAEGALQDSEERYRLLVENQTDMIVKFDADGYLTFVSQSYCKAFGKSEHELLGKKFIPLIHDEDKEAVVKALDKIHHPPYIAHVEERAMTKDGWRWQAWLNTAVLNEKNEVEAIVAVGRDINKQKQLEEERIKLEAQLQHAQKMAAISTLAGGVAHEFNNALMGIMGHIELLKMNLSDDGGIDKQLESMKDAGHRMSRLTAQLLAYAEGGKYQPKDLKLDDFVIETLPILQHNLSPTVRVETVFPKDISHIEVDHAQMQMVLSAILANSNEAIEDEGIIRITAENKDLDEDFTKQHPGLKPGLYVSLTIEDDGKGMDEETKSGIFEPFFTTKFQGRGMGMAAVYGIVMNHDGGIFVDSELGKGTVVQIYLPAIEIEVEKPKKAKSEISTGTGTILMIEDEDVVIEVTQAMLEMLGYRVMVAKTGKDAIHIAETFDGQIDLALLDIKLPDMEGGKAYPLIMKARPDLKVIVFSGYSIDGPARKILDAGAQDFLQKPFSIATLSEKLKEVLEGK